ncbi:uncharacterized protein LOC143039308 [Oratosquilla oratoria]|uniref:uncharacterized protein LOC143039308 n=1 Tax=Oratosquilla oratoria TaxID=337810 RepID=UPI003F76CFFC
MAYEPQYLEVQCGFDYASNVCINFEPIPSIYKAATNAPKWLWGCPTHAHVAQFQEEIRSVLDAGADNSLIIFANTIKRISHLHYAEENGVELLSFDNVDELYKIKENYSSAW